MNDLIRKHPSLVVVFSGILIGVVGWSWQQGIKDYTEAVKNNTCAVNQLTVQVGEWAIRTGELIKDVSKAENANGEQWKMLADHEKRLIKVEK